MQKEQSLAETHPSIKEINSFIKTNDKQLFSWRNNIEPVVPFVVMKKYLQNHTIDKAIVERDYVKKSDNPVGKAMQEIAGLEEAFILEIISPYFEVKEGKATIGETLKVRLAEIEDYKEKVRESIENWFPTGSSSMRTHREGFEKELGL